MTNSQTITLSNGLTIANFSSPHPFNFITGEVLPACDDDWAKEMMLDINETEYHVNEDGLVWTDVSLKIDVPKNVREELYKLMHNDDIDIILVPHMVLQAMKDYPMITDKCRVIRCADRITKEIYPDKFCI